MSRILHVEDCEELRSLVDYILRDVCTVVPVSTMALAREQMNVGAFDLILLDVELPDGNGYEFCSGMKNLYGSTQVPVIFLTGKSSTDEVLSGFLAGGTDYIVKPFHPVEFRARIEARLRSRPGAQPANTGSCEDQWLFSGNLRFNLLRHTVQIEAADGYRELSITPAEFKLLCHFARHPGDTMTRDRLLRECWGNRAALMSDRAIDVHICQLRKKMPEGPCRIEAVYGLGYRYLDGTQPPEG